MVQPARFPSRRAVWSGGAEPAFSGLVEVAAGAVEQILEFVRGDEGGVDVVVLLLLLLLLLLLWVVTARGSEVVVLLLLSVVPVWVVGRHDAFFSCVRVFFF